MKFKHSLWPHNELKKLVKIAALIYYLWKKYTRINKNTHTPIDTRTNTLKQTHTHSHRHAYKHTLEQRFNEFIEQSSCIVKLKKKQKIKKLIFLPINEKSIKKKDSNEQHTATLALSSIKFCVRKRSLIKKKRKKLKRIKWCQRKA